MPKESYLTLIVYIFNNFNNVFSSIYCDEIAKFIHIMLCYTTFMHFLCNLNVNGPIHLQINCTTKAVVQTVVYSIWCCLTCCTINCRNSNMFEINCTTKGIAQLLHSVWTFCNTLYICTYNNNLLIIIMKINRIIYRGIFVPFFQYS